jgi:dolichyl-phosphate-mannose-protein mannosyltransferase
MDKAKMAKSFSQRIIWVFVLAFLLRLVLIFGPYHGDINSHLAWVSFIRNFGLRGFYESFNISAVSFPNYPPLAIFSFLSVDFLYQKLFSFFWWLNINLAIFPSFFIPWFKEHGPAAFMKLPAVLADMGIGILIYYFLRKQKRQLALLGSVLFLFNPAVFYLSGLWGQIESLVVFFLFLSFILLLEKKSLWGIVAFLLSLMVKPSALIFLPVVLILFLRNKVDFRLFLKTLVSVLALIFFLSLPFFSKEPFSWFFKFYSNIISGPKEMFYLSANAFNFWSLLFGLGNIADKITFKEILAYRTWGIFLSLPLVLVILIKLWQTKKANKVFQASLLITLVIFLFMTRMHERYLFPIIPFLSVLAIINSIRFRWVYLFFSLSFFLNLYHNWWVPPINFLIVLLNNQLFIKGLTIFNLLFFLYLLFIFLEVDWFSKKKLLLLKKVVFRKKR